MKNKLSHLLLNLLLKPSMRFYRHLIIQAIIVLIILSNLLYQHYAFWGERTPLWFITFLLFNVLFYTNAYLLVPRMLLKGKPRLYFLSALGLLLFMILVGLLGYIIATPHTVTAKEALLVFPSCIPENVMFLAGVTALLLFRHCIEHKLQIQELQTATMEVELANLKNQINPHFLFNMLNNANILADEDTHKSSRLLKKLNSLLRYQISDGSKNSVSLRDDIAFLHNYLELEKTRRGRFDYTVKKEGDCDIQIPPLLFIPFVENAVKHNPESDSYVNLFFHIAGNKLHFECENPKPRLVHGKKIGGIGLANVKKRLDLLFAADYSLNLHDESEKYTVVMEFKI